MEGARAPPRMAFGARGPPRAAVALAEKAAAEGQRLTRALLFLWPPTLSVKYLVPQER